MLDYITSNHVHLLVKDTGSEVIAQSMQLIAGRIAQEFNRRKGKQRVLGRSLSRHRCSSRQTSASLYGLHRLEHGSRRRGESSWRMEGERFSEIQRSLKRYGIIHLQSLGELSGFADVEDFPRAHRQWVDEGRENGLAGRDNRWSEAIAVGSLTFVEAVE